MSYRAPIPADHRPPLPPSVPHSPPQHTNLQDNDEDVDGVPYLETPTTEEKVPAVVPVKESAGKMKMGFGVLGKRPAKTSGMSGIMIKMKPQTADAGTKKPKTDSLAETKPTSSKLVAQAFGSDSEEEEEMPPEAKLRMRNIGKNTPTSAGPNSFYKTARGFTDPRSSWRGELEKD